MSGRLTYGMILAALFLSFSSSPCYAPTDWVVNAVDFANGLVKDASSVQEEYAGYANSYLQSKVGNLGDVNSLAKKTQKISKIQERYKEAQARYEKVKALAEKVSEKKAVLQERANELKKTADKIKQEYEEEKKKIEEIKKEAQKAKEEFEEVKEDAAGLKDLVAEGVEEAKEKSGLSSEAKESGATKIEEDTNLVGSEEKPSSAQQETTISKQNQTVTTIESLAVEDKGITTEISLPVAPSTDLVTAISAAEVSEAREEQEKEPTPQPEAISKFNLEEQILMSNQAILKPQDKSATNRLKIKDTPTKLLQGSNRQSFKLIEGKTQEATNE